MIYTVGAIRKTIGIVGVLMVGCCSLPVNVLSQDIHVIKVTSPQELHDFFEHRENNIPVISGHRGGIVEGFPENSIETLENTLRHTPAFFEIDPRLTKDSVIVLMHDATLNRTTNTEGKLADYTWKEVQQFNLVDHKGKATTYKIPSLEQVIEWARGKTILNLDKKDVPLEMTADLLEKTDALSHVMLTVHHPSEARYYLNRNKDFMFSAFIRSKEEFEAYESEKIPWKQVMAYVGPLSKPENRELYDMLHERGVMVMVSAASSYDKLENNEERIKAYTKVFEDGADVLESDLPIDVAGAIRGLFPRNSPKGKYFGVQ